MPHTLDKRGIARSLRCPNAELVSDLDLTLTDSNASFRTASFVCQDGYGGWLIDVLMIGVSWGISISQQ